VEKVVPGTPKGKRDTSTSMGKFYINVISIISTDGVLNLETGEPFNLSTQRILIRYILSRRE
jgi:hypothetical protein